MKQQICSMKELAEQYFGQLPRPKVQINIQADDIVIGFESAVAHRDGLDLTFESVYFECHTRCDKDNKEECRNSVLNEFIREVTYQAEEQAKRDLIKDIMMDLHNKLCEVE